MKKKRKKKEKKEERNQDKSQIKLKSDVKRGIVAVCLFLMAVLFTFGFFGAGGAIGNFLNKVGGTVFGWGKWLFPFALVAAGAVFLYRKKTVFYIIKIVGVTIIFVSFLGFFHIFYDKNLFLEIATAGKGGGYIGYIVALVLIKLAGKVAGLVILLAVLTIGIMVTFNFSILEFFMKLAKKKEVGKEGKSTLLERLKKRKTEKKEENQKVKKEKEETKKEDEKNIDLNDNISGVKFVEGPNDEDEWKNNEDESKDDNFRNMDVSKKYKKKKSLISLNKNIIKEWQLPSLDLLEETTEEVRSGNIEENIGIIEETFSNFGIDLDMGEVKVGPMVTQYSFRPATGVKLSKIVALSDDLSLALALHPIRIEAPIPGKSLIGIEVPNKKGVRVRLKEVLESDKFEKNYKNLKLALGKDVEGNYIVSNLEKMPHLLIAGATGAGKSITINALVLSLLYQYSPDDLKMILVDPKRVELSRYNKIPHLLTDVVVDNNKVVNSLKWAVREMESRYKSLEDVGSRDLESYYVKYNQGVKRTYLNPDTGEKVVEDLKKLPYIVIIIDELADLMVSYGKEVEGVIMRLAQMSRAVGIHLVISTQRPSVEVLTGIIKANIPSRIALQVASQIDSRTILDMRGAEKLLGNGDMLFLSANSPKPKRIQSTFVSEKEVKRTVNFIKKQYAEMKKAGNVEEANIDDITKAVMNGENNNQGKFDQFNSTDLSDRDTPDILYEEAKNIIIESKKASASLLQRRLRIGYNRAARLIDELENEGVVGPAEGAKARKVLIEGNKKEINANKIQYDDTEVDQAQREKWNM